LAKIYPGTKGNVRYLAGRLRAGELVAVPSETVYGLAADAFNARACRRIFAAKDRPATDPLIVHVGSVAEAGLVAEINPAARKLMRAFWPGPLTLVLPKRAVVPDVVTSGQPSVAVRMPDHPLFLQLLAATRRPLAAPSANLFGYVSPTTTAHVQAGLGRRIKHILDGGPCEVGVESTIVDLRDPRRPRLLRPGQVTRAQLQKVLGGRVQVGPSKDSGRKAPSGTGMIAPGMLARHYSPQTLVVLHRRLTLKDVAMGDGRTAWVFRRRPARAGDNVFGWDIGVGGMAIPRAQRVGTTRSAFAHNLFAVLRELDGQGWKSIQVELAPPGGIGDAINDRLTRAAAKTGALLL
jgi:L-threonylcarbamoyladenylate synthase